MDTVREVVRQFAAYGRVVRPYVGVTLVELSNGGSRGHCFELSRLAVYFTVLSGWFRLLYCKFLAHS